MGGPLSGVVRWLLWAAARLGARIRTFAALDFAALSAVSKRHPRWSSSTAADSYTAGWRRARRHRRARGAGRQAAVGGGGAARQLSTSEKGRLHPRRPFLVPQFDARLLLIHLYRALLSVSERGNPSFKLILGTYCFFDTSFVCPVCRDGWGLGFSGPRGEPDPVSLCPCPSCRRGRTHTPRVSAHHSRFRLATTSESGATTRAATLLPPRPAPPSAAPPPPPTRRGSRRRARAALRPRLQQGWRGGVEGWGGWLLAAQSILQEKGRRRQARAGLDRRSPSSTTSAKSSVVAEMPPPAGRGMLLLSCRPHAALPGGRRSPAHLSTAATGAHPRLAAARRRRRRS